MSGFKRRKKADVTALANQLDKMTSKGNYESDPNEWTVTKDSNGNGSAIIRFLPAKGENGEDVPFVKIYSHGFKENGQWYIENCPTTLGGECPVCDGNRELWNSGIEDNKKIASNRKRKLSYWANIVVIQDKNNPEAEGKVFKYRFGAKIMEKIIAMAKPGEEELASGVQPIDVTDPWEGANFILKVQKKAGFPNYDNSKFGPVGELFDGDEDKLGAVYEGMHALNPIIDASEFREYGELETKFNKVTGGKSVARSVEEDLNEDLDNLNQVDTDLDEDVPFDLDGDSADSVDEAVSTETDDDLDEFFNDL